MTARFTRAIVIGGSSGIGESMAKKLSDGGATVAVLGRRSEELNRVVQHAPAVMKSYLHDVRRFDEIPELFERIVKDLGGVDTIVYASGVFPKYDEGEYDFQKDRDAVEVNLLGAMAWLNLAAARFEAQGSGNIIGISSIAGERGRRPSPAYYTSKAALTTYLECLRNRCARAGVNVVTIKPGYVDTAMTRGMKGLFWVIPPEKAAETSLALARKGTGASAFVPWRWTLVALIIRWIPSFIFRRLNL